MSGQGVYLAYQLWNVHIMSYRVTRSIGEVPTVKVYLKFKGVKTTQTEDDDSAAKMGSAKLNWAIGD